MKKFILLIACLVAFRLHAQQLIYTDNPPLTTQAKYGSMRNVFNVAIIPALMIDSCEFSAAIYMEKKFMLDQLKMARIAAWTSFGNSGILLLLQKLGNMDYTEDVASLSYARMFNGVSLSADFRYVIIKAGNSKKVSAFQGGLSGVVSITESVKAAVCVANPKFFSPTDPPLRLPSYAIFGIGWQCTRSLYAGIETLKVENQPMSITAAIQYNLSNGIIAAISWSVTSNQPGISFRWSIGSMSIEAGACYHADLGASPFTLISYEQKASR